MEENRCLPELKSFPKSSGVVSFHSFFFFSFSIIYLAALDLSCGTWDLMGSVG